MLSKQNNVYVLGNGESRKNIDVNHLRTLGKVYGCNAIYRDTKVDVLVCIDDGISHEVYTSGYAKDNVCYLKDWSPLPAEILNSFVHTDMFKDTEVIENERGDKESFVLHGCDSKMYDELLDEGLKLVSDKEDFKVKMGKKQTFITWLELQDKVKDVPREYEGWSAGPIAVRIAVENEKPDNVFLLGFDLKSNDGKINNLYKGTDNYYPSGSKEIYSGNWIKQHSVNFKLFPDVNFIRVVPDEINSNAISSEVDEWKQFENIRHATLDKFENL